VSVPSKLPLVTVGWPKLMPRDMKNAIMTWKKADIVFIEVLRFAKYFLTFLAKQQIHTNYFFIYNF
jgi:hypothetical protein